MRKKALFCRKAQTDPRIVTESHETFGETHDANEINASQSESLAPVAEEAKKQPSRKGKKAWRKNIDLTSVEKTLEAIEQEKLTFGAKISEAADSELFSINVKGDAKGMTELDLKAIILSKRRSQQKEGHPKEASPLDSLAPDLTKKAIVSDVELKHSGASYNPTTKDLEDLKAVRKQLLENAPSKEALKKARSLVKASIKDTAISAQLTLSAIKVEVETALQAQAVKKEQTAKKRKLSKLLPAKKIGLTKVPIKNIAVASQPSSTLRQIQISSNLFKDHYVGFQERNLIEPMGKKIG
ncbi:hypothetical protein L0F63_007123, partial [Massospora cicadina]